MTIRRDESFYCKQEKSNGSPKAEALDRVQVSVVSREWEIRLVSFIRLDTRAITASLDQFNV